MGIVIPCDRLRAETLDALIEEFVTRDGAVHGHTDTPIERQIAAVRRQLKSGDAVILYDEETESLTILPKDKS
ncbi:MAG: YheU family protein [Tepidisphaerales bacterium]